MKRNWRCMLGFHKWHYVDLILNKGLVVCYRENCPKALLINDAEKVAELASRKSTINPGGESDE